MSRHLALFYFCLSRYPSGLVLGTLLYAIALRADRKTLHNLVEVDVHGARISLIESALFREGVFLFRDGNVQRMFRKIFSRHFSNYFISLLVIKWSLFLQFRNICATDSEYFIHRLYSYNF